LDCVIDIRSLLGETPVWSTEEQALYWIDCMASTVHRYDPGSGQDVILPLAIDGYLGAIALTRDSGILVFCGSGLWHHPAGGPPRRLAEPDADRPQNVPNDGKCDPQGRFWFGTMHAASAEPTGRLFRFDAERGLAVMDDGFACANGMGWSPDGHTMYFVDMIPGNILAYDFDGVAGTIKNRRVFASISPDEGMPDGIAVDAEGGVWVAHWDGWCISRFAPDGRRERKIDVPAQRPTCPTFGGNDLRDLYLTSSAADLPEDSLARAPHSGGVFRLRTDVAGPKTVRFQI